MKVSLSLILPLIGLSLASSVCGQQLSVQQPLTYNSKEIWFDKIVSRENTGLINGPEYFMPFKGAHSHPFFGSMDLASERVLYDDQVYENVPIFYDVYRDILVLRIRDKNGLFAMVAVDKNRAGGFTLYGHQFRKLEDPKSTREKPLYQYFDVLFEGKELSLVAKRTKTSHVSGFVTDYETEDSYFFIRDGKWSQLSGVKSFYALQPDHKNDITEFIETKEFKIRKKIESDFIAIATYCDALEGTLK